MPFVTRRPRYKILTLRVWATLLVSACTSEGPQDTGISDRVALTGTVEPVPFTTTPAIALLGDRACMIDSYAKQVFCAGPTGGDTARYGGEGKGPGEFTVPIDVVPLGGGGLGVLDFALQRFTAFRADGAVNATIHFDATPWPVLGEEDSLIALVARTLGPGQMENRNVEVFWFYPRRGVLRRLRLSVPNADLSRPLLRGAWSSRRGFVFTALPYTLVRFSADGRYLGKLTPEHYEPELPNSRDVEDHVRAMKRLFGTRPSAADVRSFRETPKAGIHPGARFTADGLLWIATTRNDARRSYLDVFDGGSRYIGSIAVRDRLMAFDVVGRTLAVLVERVMPAADGIRDLAIDWYDVGAWVSKTVPH